MARNKYQSDKRQKEIRKKLKKGEKEQRKMERSAGGGTADVSTASEPGVEVHAPAAVGVEATTT